MFPIATYVFLDLETTGLPVEELNKTRITELSMVAVKRTHLLTTRAGTAPRVQNKLTLCFNPGRFVQPGSTETTGLCNELLIEETRFDKEAFNALNSFLNILSKPVCLIAQNGHNFDFPILKNHLVKISASFSEDVLCADCLHSFYDILAALKSTNTSVEQPKEEVENCNTKNINEALSGTSDKTELNYENSLAMKIINETTPKRLKIKSGEQILVNRLKLSKVQRRFPWNADSKPKESYKLKNIYERVLHKPGIEAHRAENDCIMALEVAVALGLLLVTGVLWGCTNPFIRRGTKGLRSVTADGWIAQAYAEIAFLLGNWRYVLPFIINQCGSLAYLLAVQDTPLSVSVPTVNGLTFAFTAITGATVGFEEKLDRASILGIVLIVVGTAMCCWND